VPSAQVIILGGGIVGCSAAEVALGMGANVAILVRSARTADELSQRFGTRARILATPESIGSLCASADAVIAAALVPGGAAPKLISTETVKRMNHGAVIIDVSIDQGGCAETSHPTTHTQPTFIVDGVVHYCVANMPGAVPRTSTFALNDATRPFIVAIANKGLSRALTDNEHLRNGLNVHDGQITCRAVADALRLPYARVDEVLAV
jgi:alanine dehydrogenase